MNQQTVNIDQQTLSPTATAVQPSRCEHRFANRTRCRLLTTSANPRFCTLHASLPENLQPDDLTAELTSNPHDLDSFEGLHTFLAQLLILLSQNRVSTRRAAVLSYITSQLIRTLSAAHKKEAATPPQIIFDAPRPIRD